MIGYKEEEEEERRKKIIIIALISNRANCLSVFCSLRRQYPSVFTQNFPTYHFLHIFNEFGLKHEISHIFPYVLKYFSLKI